ncbi:hypothetical protein DPMN_030417 [Dreissena polymorpha]|uniref:Uncharacterized protein n=1 Tax=Dreissena polymorpha TaxID=45954 RepID=A0A9D4M0C5_DREPO|nr:hypothetical protein DPMN_030417 [Dreissena polymorpha]
MPTQGFISQVFDLTLSQVSDINQWRPINPAFSSADSKESALDSVACSHSRAHGVFTESINSLDCQFLGYPCPGGYVRCYNL